MCLGVPGRIIQVFENDVATVDVNGNQLDVNIRLTPAVNLGDYVLIHAGFAMEVIDEDLAHETMQLLLQLQEIRESLPLEEQSSHER